MTFSKYRRRRVDKYQRRSERLARMRAAKERKRLANLPTEPEPILVPWHRFEIGVRDKLIGPQSYGEAWTDFKSIRDAVRRLRVIRSNCIVGTP